MLSMVLVAAKTFQTTFRYHEPFSNLQMM